MFNEQSKVLCEAVVAIYLFGSHARNTMDASSDVDVLAVVRDHHSSEALNKVTDLLRLSDIDVDASTISIYSIDSFRDLARRGSLFLHHLVDEGILLYDAMDDGLRHELSTLPPYVDVRDDIIGFRAVIVDSSRGLLQGRNVQFEFVNCAAALRHASILLCHVSGRPHYAWDTAIVEALRQSASTFTEAWALRVYQEKRRIDRNESEVLGPDTLVALGLATGVLVERILITIEENLGAR